MRKVILVMLLTAMSNCAVAELVNVGSNENTSIYVDTDSIKKTGSMAKMSHLTDFRTANKDMGEYYRSTRDLNEYDCKGAKWRRRAFSEHSKNMGAGKVVYKDSFTARWRPVPPESGVEILWKFACTKR